jgi:heme exporter protein CcmD
MNWPDLSMGKYAFYVWGSYIFSLVVIIWELVSLRLRKKALLQQQQRQQRSTPVSPSVLTGSANETTS